MKYRLWKLVAIMVLAAMLVIPAQAAQLDHVTDQAGLLSSSQLQQLEQQAQTISQQYGVGVYVITMNDYQTHTAGDLYDAADEFYYSYELGLGEERNAILLLLSMAERDYLLIAYGAESKYAFTDSGREKMMDFILDDLGSDAWYLGFADYLNWSADYLEQAEKGTPYAAGNLPMSASERFKAIGIRLAIILLVPFAIAGAYISTLSKKMKSVAEAVVADTYVSDALQLTRENDRFAYTTTTRRKIENDSKTSRSSSGGGSGTSGKF